MSLVRFVRSTAVILGLGITTAPHTGDHTPRPAEFQADRARIRDHFGKLPLSFVENRGQVDERVAYTLRSPGHSTYFKPDGLTLRLTQGKGQDARAHTIKVELVNAATQRIESRGSAPGVVSYFNGPRDQWKTAIPTHASIGYVQPWPGIDLSYRGHGGRLESIYTVAPHANPAQIKLRYSGQTSLKLDDDGNLVLTSSVGEVRETAPILYQEIDAKRIPVEGRYALLDDNTVAFDVAKYDPDHALVIDPTLAYAGYFGGTGDDEVRGIAVDSAGNAYLVGYTSSTETMGFPLSAGPDATHNGGDDAFVIKVNPAGTALLYAGYIGGSGNDRGLAIAVDSAGSAYVTGQTFSFDGTFPVLGGPDLVADPNASEAFVAKVSADGTTLVYSGFIGGSGGDIGYGIAVDGGNAYVTGSTTSTAATFPILGGPDLVENGTFDAFVARVNAAGTALDYAGFIGGSGFDDAYGIAVDGAGNAYVTGETRSTESMGFPVLGGPDLSHNGGMPGAEYDAFVTKVNASGTLVYSGYIGGGADDHGYAIAVDGTGNAYVTGSTSSIERGGRIERQRQPAPVLEYRHFAHRRREPRQTVAQRGEPKRRDVESVAPRRRAETEARRERRALSASDPLDVAPGLCQRARFARLGRGQHDLRHLGRFAQIEKQLPAALIERDQPALVASLPPWAREAILGGGGSSQRVARHEFLQEQRAGRGRRRGGFLEAIKQSDGTPPANPKCST